MVIKYDNFMILKNDRILRTPQIKVEALFLPTSKNCFFVYKDFCFKNCFSRSFKSKQ